MPVTCEIDSEGGLVRTTFRGQVDIEEVVRALEDLLQRPDFRRGLNGIVDLREGDTDTQARDVKRLATMMERCRDQIGPSRTAIVVAKDVTYGMARMYQAYAESTSIETMIFRSIDDAHRWLAESAPMSHHRKP
jgi:hypothetical protein